MRLPIVFFFLLCIRQLSEELDENVAFIRHFPSPSGPRSPPNPRSAPPTSLRIYNAGKMVERGSSDEGSRGSAVEGVRLRGCRKNCREDREKVEA